MEDNREFERLIAKSKAQIEEREKMIKELMELNEMEQKRRRLEQLSSETRMLESESKRLKDIIKADSHAAEERMTQGRHQGAYNQRHDEPMERHANKGGINEETRELIALTRELRAELSKHREQVMHPKSAENYRGHEQFARSSEREDLIHRLNSEIRHLEKTLAAQGASGPGATHAAPQHAPVHAGTVHHTAPTHAKLAQLSEAELKELHALREETKKIKTEIDKQKSDNHKRDRDMSRVINLLEQMSRDEDE